MLVMVRNKTFECRHAETNEAYRYNTYTLQAYRVFNLSVSTF